MITDSDSHLWFYQECTTGHTHSPMSILHSVLKTMVIQVFADSDGIENNSQNDNEDN